MKPGRLSLTMLFLLYLAAQATISRAQDAYYLSENSGSAGTSVVVYSNLPYGVACYVKWGDYKGETFYPVAEDYISYIEAQSKAEYTISWDALPGQIVVFYCEDPDRLKTLEAAGELNGLSSANFSVTQSESPGGDDVYPVPPTTPPPEPVPQTVFGSITTASGTRSNDGCASNPAQAFRTTDSQIVVVALAYNVQPRQSYSAYWYYNGQFVYESPAWISDRSYKQLCLSYAITPYILTFQPGSWIAEVLEYPDKIDISTSFVIQQPPTVTPLPPTFTPLPPTLPPTFTPRPPTLIPTATLTWTPTSTPTYTATPTATQEAVVIPVPTTPPTEEITPLGSFLGPILDVLKKIPVEIVFTIGLGTLGTLAITGIKRVRRKNGNKTGEPTDPELWEQQAQTDEPGIPCQQGRFYCKKVKINTTLTRYKIGCLKLTAYDRANQSSPLVREIKGTVVDDLNKALEARRRGEPADYLAQLVIPASNHLLREVVEWLHAHPDSHDVTVNGHVEGSNMKFKFTLYMCVPAAYQNVWEVESEWEKTVTDAWDSPITLIQNVHHNMTGKPLEDLSQELVTFIRGI
jgi:hypothetical protein